MSEGSLVSQNALIIKDLRVVSACNLSYRSNFNDRTNKREKKMKNGLQSKMITSRIIII
jgi:hypothetical protein